MAILVWLNKERLNTFHNDQRKVVDILHDENRNIIQLDLAVQVSDRKNLTKSTEAIVEPKTTTGYNGLTLNLLIFQLALWLYAFYL